MKALVLVSDGRHPVSGKPCLPRTEAQAARLAASVARETAALHAGPSSEMGREGLGRGLSHFHHVALAPKADPLPALVSAIRGFAPDFVLAGPRAQGGEDTGLLPYAIAHALAWPIVANAIALEEAGPDLMRIVQALPKGARRFVVVRLPALVTVHPGAPAPLPFVHGKARAGTVVSLHAEAQAVATRSELETRPYRMRPKVMARAPTSAREETKGRVLIHPEPREAAREIIAFLRGVGVLGPPA
jgi:electron transfer flavoprotein beta subunit